MTPCPLWLVGRLLQSYCQTCKQSNIAEEQREIVLQHLPSAVYELEVELCWQVVACSSVVHMDSGLREVVDMDIHSHLQT